MKIMRINSRLMFCVVLLAFPLAASPAFATGQTPAVSDIVLKMDHGLTSLSAHNVHLSRILSLLAAQTGLMVVIDKQADPLLTIEIKDMPLIVALNRLLQGVSHAAIYERRSSGGRPDALLHDERVLVELHVYPKGQPGPSDAREVFGSPATSAGLSAELYDLIAARDTEAEAAARRVENEEREIKAYQAKKQMIAYIEEKQKEKQAIASLPASTEEQGKEADLLVGGWTQADELNAYLEKKKKQKETGEEG